ncbi:hypothetical protein BH23ACT10_BH23ACT10_07120 [soil metagenome]
MRAGVILVAVVLVGIAVATYRGHRAVPQLGDVGRPVAGSDALTAECHGVRVGPDDHVERIVRESAGETICFRSGVYRLSEPIAPTADQQLIAEPGAVLSGAVPVWDWQREGQLWRASAPLSSSTQPHGQCIEGDACQYPEMLFVDDRPLTRVEVRDDVGPGRFWIDSDAAVVWMADDPTGRAVELSRTPAAVVSEAQDVVVRGFVVERFANSAQTGAIQADGGGWTIERNDVRHNHGGGVRAHGGRVLENHIHDNGQIGLIGTGTDQVVRGNEIDHNNIAGFDDTWEAGGTKFAYSTGLLIEGNNVHHNRGPGLWTDINNIDTTVQRNVVHDNTSHGIFHEISYAAVIRYNRVTRNGTGMPVAGWGGSGIRIAGSPDIEVHHNTLVGNQNGIMLVEQDRPDPESPLGPHIIANVTVHDNDISPMPGGLTGLVDDTGTMDSYARGVEFSDNMYRLPSPNVVVFAWRGEQWGPAAWKERFGHDASGTFSVS